MVSNAHERTETLDHVLRGIEGMPTLTPDDERRLCRAAAGGDERAAGRVVAANLRRVVHVATEHRHAGLPLEDLIHEGVIGLLEALPRFDTGRGVRFFTYASFLVRRRIIQALARGTKTVRVPRQVAARVRRFRAERDRLSTAAGQSVDAGTVARSLGLKPTEDPRSAFSVPFEISVDEPLPGSTTTRGDLLAGTDDEAPDAEFEARQDLDELRQAMSLLAPRDRRILEERFGLGGRPPRTLRELAGILSLSKERVRQLEERAKGTLRAHLGARRQAPACCSAG